MSSRVVSTSLLTVVCTVVLAACGGGTATPAATTAPVAVASSVAVEPTAAAPSSDAPVAAAQTDLSGVRTYLLEKTTALTEHTGALKTASDTYYELAKAQNFDYAALWSQNKDEVVTTITAAREAWLGASPSYEQMEGIVAGTPSLADFDVILDAGTSGEESAEDAVPFDLTLPDGRTLPKPGNLFGVTESTLWGTYPEYVGLAEADFDGNGTQDLGDALPDANVLKGGVDTLQNHVADLSAAANGWQPTEAEAFGALVTMVPTMSEYFESWKNSRFVAGEASTQRDFVAISRLSDINDILGGLQIVYQQLSPVVRQADATQDSQISSGLEDLRLFVNDVRAKEQSGERFSAEDADTLGAEAQNRATAVTGQIAQVAAKLNIPLENQ